MDEKGMQCGINSLAKVFTILYGAPPSLGKRRNIKVKVVKDLGKALLLLRVHKYFCL